MASYSDIVTAKRWPFGDLTPMKYGFIFADPPWRFQLRSAKGEKKSAQAQYACMSLDAIKALPVSHLASKDCVLQLWATAPMIPQQLDVMATWGFRYISMGTWHKTTRHGKTAFGPGYWLRSAAEFWLLGVVGTPKHSLSARNIIVGEAREHSRKPEEAYQWAESYMPHAYRCELFSRQRRPGWDSWGNEVDLFQGVA
jgi:N6-adenosine-specific RNA methylase IME4